MNPWDQFSGANAGYVYELYERYQRDPSTVDEATRRTFATWPADARPDWDEPRQGPTAASIGRDGADHVATAIAAHTLAESIRRFGHLAARLDPLGFHDPIGDPSLSPQSHGLTADALKTLPASIVSGPAAAGAANAHEAIAKLRDIYCSTTGHDYNHVFVPDERVWLRDAVESCRFRPPNDLIDARELLDRITQVETFERFLHRTFPGKTRFSIEGLDMMVPVLDEIVHDAAENGVQHVMIAMAHRGRLNVLAHILQKPYSQILAEFKDPIPGQRLRVDLGWMGDVKYHAGARVEAHGLPKQIVISMPPNPSHLEAVEPVLTGMVRAEATSLDRPGAPIVDKGRVLAILIHGDAAFPGQGVVAETLNLSRLDGYDVGGTIHIIANNQLGFTTDPEESYSTSYASGLARGFKIPITHVNADDPVACIEAARLAIAYRQRFKLDYLIDLVGYRRYGHNEGDEPAFTQPQIYQIVAAHPTVREKYARALIESGSLTREQADAMVKTRMEELERAYASVKPEQDYVPPVPEVPPSGAAKKARTAVPIDSLKQINDALLTVPEGFTVHRKLERGRERRKAMFASATERSIDWASAEELALATILADGVPVRFTGEDVERGTFSHRHAVYHDAVTGETHVPLQRLPQARASFEIRNSPLSEYACVGFELGYNLQQPRALVLWEAQYGDFINGAQIILDEYLTSGRAKWGMSPSLALLLPHGYEGQGPDHSSARLERFLNAAADINMRVANCTTAAQYFHLLRRQAALLTTDPLPLIVMTPKSLLRHPFTASTPRELAEGAFQRVIDDPASDEIAGKVRRLAICSGKIAVDLLTSERRKDNPNVAIVRVEQLYPFPEDAVAAILERYEKVREVCWVQEEPENMGAWEFVRPLLETTVSGRHPLRYIGRSRNSSPSEGSSTWHAANQRAIVDQVFEAKIETREMDRVLSKQV
ncbi:MAG TPA: 2-oxoglutarate dehydrogenase E1 component [Vicinamibacterales bacterium]|nr:2-oxoglutarate dehydrogenase E1 component [Vicinamibacterales bacterium]